VEAEPAAAGGQPSSRGWTMFMEAELQGKEEPKEPKEAEPEQRVGEPDEERARPEPGRRRDPARQQRRQGDRATGDATNPAWS